MVRKKNSSGVEGSSAVPKVKKQRWYHNIRDAYRLTREVNPTITWILLGVFVLVMGLSLAIGFVWGHPWYGPTKTLDVHVASIRRKLGDAAWIDTVRGVGFALRPPDTWDE